MALTTLLRGFTGKIQLDGYCALLTSYSLTLNTNVIKSQATAQLLNNIPGIDNNSKNDELFKAVALQPIRDYPAYELNVSIQLNQSIYQRLLTFLKGYFRTPINVKFSDDSLDLELDFENCYVNSFNLVVENGAAATASLTFSYYKDTFDLITSDHELIQGNKTSDYVKTLMPYYKWKFDYGTQEYEINNFSFNFTQAITPKFGCTGSQELKAIAPIAYVISIPTMTFQVTWIINNQLNLSEIDGFEMGNNLYSNMNQCKIQYFGTNPIILNKCYAEVYTPQLGNAGSVNMLSISGSVYGKIEIQSTSSNSEGSSNSEN